MARFKIKIEYLGTAYCGWQRQNGQMSIQQKLEEAARSVFGVDTLITGAGRTDAGVHAAGQAAHFDADTLIPAEKIADALNAYLPRDISVIDCQEVSEDFHARFFAKIKTYTYTIINSRHRSALNDARTVHVRATLDVHAMKKAAQAFVGKHDFAAFCAAGSEVKSTVREIFESRVDKCGEVITYTVKGSGFLYNQVRIIAGTLIAVGLKKISAEAVPHIIDSRDRSLVPATALAKGLTLTDVEY